MEKFKEWVEIVSKLSTIGIFILAIFGYFYTVKPKFLLDNMKIEMIEIQKKVNSLIKNKNTLENKISVLENDKKKIVEDFKKIKTMKNIELEQLTKNINLQKEEYSKQLLLLKKEIKKQKNIATNISEENNFLRKMNNESRWMLFKNYLSNINLKSPYENKDDSRFYLSERIAYYNKHPIIRLRNNDKFLLKEDAPFDILLDGFLSIKYSKNVIFRESEFYYLKEKAIKLLKKNKNIFTYNNSILSEKQNNLNQLIENKLKKIKFLDKLKNKYEISLIKKDIYQLHNEFRNTRVKAINQLNESIKNGFKGIINLDLKNSNYVWTSF